MFCAPAKRKIAPYLAISNEVDFFWFSKNFAFVGKISNLAEMFQVSQQFAIYLSLSGLICNPGILENPIEIITRCPTAPGSSLVNFTLKPNGSLSWTPPKNGLKNSNFRGGSHLNYHFQGKETKHFPRC